MPVWAGAAGDLSSGHVQPARRPDHGPVPGQRLPAQRQLPVHHALSRLLPLRAHPSAAGAVPPQPQPAAGVAEKPGHQRGDRAADHVTGEHRPLAAFSLHPFSRGTQQRRELLHRLLHHQHRPLLGDPLPAGPTPGGSGRGRCLTVVDERGLFLFRPGPCLAQPGHAEHPHPQPHLHHPKDPLPLPGLLDRRLDGDELQERFPPP